LVSSSAARRSLPKIAVVYLLIAPSLRNSRDAIAPPGQENGGHRAEDPPRERGRSPL
jgi:hypothetical protein